MRGSIKEDAWSASRYLTLHSHSILRGMPMAEEEDWISVK